MFTRNWVIWKEIKKAFVSFNCILNGEIAGHSSFNQNRPKRSNHDHCKYLHHHYPNFPPIIRNNPKKLPTASLQTSQGPIIKPLQNTPPKCSTRGPETHWAGPISCSTDRAVANKEAGPTPKSRPLEIAPLCKRGPKWPRARSAKVIASKRAKSNYQLIVILNDPALPPAWSATPKNARTNETSEL